MIVKMFWKYAFRSSGATWTETLTENSVFGLAAAVSAIDLGDMTCRCGALSVNNEFTDDYILSENCVINVQPPVCSPLKVLDDINANAQRTAAVVYAHVVLVEAVGD